MAHLTPTNLLRTELPPGFFAYAAFCAAELSDGFFVADATAVYRTRNAIEHEKVADLAGQAWAMHGTPDGDEIWVGGARGTLIMSDDNGETWTTIVHPLQGIYASRSSTDQAEVKIRAIWVVPDGSKVYTACRSGSAATGGSAQPALIYSSIDKGVNWVLEQTVTGYHPFCITGLASGEVWVGGARSGLYTTSGSGTWTAVTLPTTTSQSVSEITAVSSSEIYAKIHNTTSDFWGSSGLVAQTTGSYLQYNGTTWATLTTGLPAGAFVQSLWAAPGQLYIGAWDPTGRRGLIRHSTDGGSSFVTEFQRAHADWSSGTGVRGGVTYVTRLLAANGTTPEIFALSYFSWTEFSGAAGPARVAFRSDIGATGGAWITAYGDVVVTALWAFGPGDVWVGGSFGLLAHWNGTAWTEFEVPVPSSGYTSEVTSIWGTSSNNLYVAEAYHFYNGGTTGRTAGQTRIFHTEDAWTTWTTEFTSTATRINCLWGSGPTDVWAVGGLRRNSSLLLNAPLAAGAGSVLHSAGTGTWNAVTLAGVSAGAGENLVVHGTGPTDVWIFNTGTSGMGVHRGSSAGMSLVGEPTRISTAHATATHALLFPIGQGPPLRMTSGGVLTAEARYGRFDDMTVSGAWAISGSEIYAAESSYSAGQIDFSPGTGRWYKVPVVGIDDPPRLMVGIGSRIYCAAGTMGVYYFQGPPTGALEPTLTSATPVARRRWATVTGPLGGVVRSGALANLTTGPLAGQAIYVGGANSAHTHQSVVQFFDPVTRTWTLGPSMTYARESPRALTLIDGRVLVFGGVRTGADSARRSVEIYDPISNTWSMGATSPVRWVSSPKATLMTSGRVFVLSDQAGLVDGRAAVLIYDPTLNAWTTVASPLFDGYYCDVCIMPSGPHAGRPFIFQGDNDAVQNNAGSFVFDETTSSFTKLSTHTALQAEDQGSFWGIAPVQGKVIAYSDCWYGKLAQVYDPITDAWFDAGNDGSSGTGPVPAIVLSEGVLLQCFAEDRTAYARYYDPRTNSWYLVDEWPNAVAMSQDDTWPDNLFDEMYVQFIAAIRLTNGEVLVAAAWNEDSGSTGGAAVLELDPTEANFQFVSVGHMRTDHAYFNPGGDLVLLQDGTVFTAGGRSEYLEDASGTNTTERFNPVSGVWTMDRPMHVPRQGHQLTKLQDGRVIVTGGVGGSFVNAAYSPTFRTHLARAEIFDPATGTWTAAASMGTARQQHRATLLTAGPNAGRILVTGGAISFVLPDSEYTASCEIYNPATNTWTSTGSMTRARGAHAQVQLGDGRIVVIGGTVEDAGSTTINDYAFVVSHWDEGPLAVNLGDGPGNHIEIYNPTTGTWAEVATTTHSRFRPRATLLPDGRVFIYQGLTGEMPELFDPVTNTVTVLGTNPLGMRQEHSQCLLADGRLLIAGGADYVNHEFPELYLPHLKSTYVFDPETNAFTVGPEMIGGRAGHGAATLADGSVLIAGGKMHLSWWRLAGETGATERLMGEETPEVETPETFTDRVYPGPRIREYHPLGGGIVRPFYRAEHGDFCSDQGVNVILSNMGQVVGTNIATLPWRTEFGSNLHPLRHRANNTVVREIARAHVRDALGRWDQRVQLQNLTLDRITSTSQNQIVLRALLSIEGSEGSVRLEVPALRLEEADVTVELLAWAVAGGRVPRGMGYSAQPIGEGFVQPDAFATGIARPFQRLHGDFRSGSGIQQILGNAGQVLGTECKTLPWRTELGSSLQPLRHRASLQELRDLAAVYVEDALRKWEPRVRLTKIEKLDRRTSGENTIDIRALTKVSILEEAATYPLPITLK